MPSERRRKKIRISIFIMKPKKMNIYGIHAAGAGGGEVLCSPMMVTDGAQECGPRRLGRFLVGTQDWILPLLGALAVPRRASREGAITITITIHDSRQK